MSTVPHLSRGVLESELDRLYAERGRLLVALHGTGDKDTLEIRGANVRVVPVGSELELRRELLGVDLGDRVAFLVRGTVALPIDLQGRFAKNGRIFRVGPEARVQNLFGATEVEDGVRDCPLGEYLLKYPLGERLPVAGGRLTVDAMWSTWLARVWGLPAGGELALDVLLGWTAVDGRGPLFVATMEERGAGAVRTGLLAHLERRLGPAGPVVWKAWEAGRGAAALELGLVLHGLRARLTVPEVALWTRLASQEVLGKVEDAVLVRLGEVADTALRSVEQRSGAPVVRALVAAADRRAAVPELAPHLSGSNRLPSAWRARLEQLGEALLEVARAPGHAAVRATIERLRLLETHEAFADPEQTATVLRADMAVRLAAWLATGASTPNEPSLTPYGEVEALAGWYVREGGYLDWARRAARGGGDGAFARGASAIVTAVDGLREELDRRFARALPAWHTAGRPATQLIPIDQVIKRIAGPFLDEDAERKLLVVLMDGMAWAQAVELLGSMGGRTSAWGPLAWHGIGKHRVGDAPYPPVITNFPTLTEVSRSALFAGKPMPPGTTSNTADDPKRWQANRVVLEHTAANDQPVLLLKGEGHTKDGSASTEALSQVADTRRRLVGVVINAIDMSLKSDPAHRHQWTVDTVKSLRDLLDKAAEVGRAVLLCSDHGHVPADRLNPSGAAMKEGARWRTWQTAGDPVQGDYEIALAAGDGVWAPRGAHGVVLIADDAHRYGGGPYAGEHGGASLAEVVAPCVLIGSADGHAAQEDSGQAVRPLRAPGWWHFDLGAEARADTGEHKKATKRRVQRTDAQLTLPTVPVPEPPATAPPPVRVRAAESPLAKSELLAARAPAATVREQIITAVEFLLARANNNASAAAFAEAMGVLESRVQGLVSNVLQGPLNVDGYQILRFERQSRTVCLDKEKLLQQFEVKL